MTGSVAILGAGTAGAGWAARFALMGWSVRVFDPDPDAAARVASVLDNARRALPGLSDRRLPPEGDVVHAATISQAVSGADWIQESVPERLDLKRTLYQKVQEHAADDAIIASSTAGFTPTALYGQGARRCQIVVAHPFNPVYLLPLVELVMAEDAPGWALERAEQVLRGIGMMPLPVRREIDGHIADRLMEAVWREALWLVHDGVATTAEIDEAVRMGVGLNWAQMGPFESALLSGGAAGVDQVVSRIGSGLDLPRTHLTEMPEATEALARIVADQAGAQAGGRPLEELERIRDRNLVAVLRALKWADWGAGAHLRDVDALLENGAAEIAGPIRSVARTVPLDWVDHNGHMTEARYMQVFSDATDRVVELMGCDAAYIAGGASFFTVESHIRHLAEAKPGAALHVESLCLAAEGRKLHLFHRLFAEGREVATAEALLVHVSLETRQAAEPGAELARRMAEIARAHAGLPRPAGVGRSVGQKPL
ncbi:carnitine 3-dehydrogenase [Rhodovulum sulfidophilum]|uniref:carnitine 3-dehydrogenase n=1 Tax=Rhodovulum sulfidophilum TaxID=35806 RepID=UPI000952E3B0|nr:carnitine 3-dehydrogenase [Rhodovulum sulfidophilum]OLS52237.1 carnitine 3-dehydrogenase [Rhodovulum sulfidophilum]